ncbi:MAG TPA: polymer-forming cytoskeletal protein [Caulobacteraceae bacterium]|jgi:cytoskeletal protein CcmA (bactofilin family)|nr:polymer-forming cytoskeletal protein [Caulobacteraceae bacterium]
MSSAPTPQPEPARPAPRPAQRGISTIGADMLFEGDISGGGEILVDGTIKGDVRVEHVTVGDGGQIEGGVYAEAVEVRGRVSGSITAKQVRLYGACHVDGDITHEQLAMETGAFFQGRSLRLQRPAAAPAKPAPTPAPAARETPAAAPPLTPSSPPAGQA